MATANRTGTASSDARPQAAQPTEGAKKRLSAKARREEQAWRQQAAEAEAQVAREAAKLAQLPATGDEFAQRAAKLFWAMFNAFLDAKGDSTPTESGYFFSAADGEKFLAMGRGLYWEIRNADPLFDEAHRLRGLNAARKQAAKADAPLQRLLRQAAEVQSHD